MLSDDYLNHSFGHSLQAVLLPDAQVDRWSVKNLVLDCCVAPCLLPPVRKVLSDSIRPPSVPKLGLIGLFNPIICPPASKQVARTAAFALRQAQGRERSRTVARVFSVAVGSAVRYSTAETVPSRRLAAPLPPEKTMTGKTHADCLRGAHHIYWRHGITGCRAGSAEFRTTETLRLFRRFPNQKPQSLKNANSALPASEQSSGGPGVPCLPGRC